VFSGLGTKTQHPTDQVSLLGDTLELIVLQVYHKKSNNIIKMLSKEPIDFTEGCDALMLSPSNP
jgi:hypothetical protein